MTLTGRALRSGYRLNRFEVLGSTNDEAMQRAAAGDRGRLWIVADAQSAGRGRQGRAWASPRGNLHASLLLVDVVPPAIAWQLGFVAGIALADAVRAVLADAGSIAIKWPNDLLCGEAKVAGILVEGSRVPNGRFAVVLGFGVNCVASPPDTPYPATNLSALSPNAPSCGALFGALSDALPDALALWDEGRGFAAVRAAWLARALAPGTRMSVSARGRRLSGLFETMDPEGRLVLSTPDGPATIDVGDVLLTETPVAAG